MTELGYLLPRYRLKNQMSDPTYFTKSFVLDDVPFYGLLARKELSLRDFVYDGHSFGKLLEDNGCRALPSPTYEEAWPTKGKEKVDKVNQTPGSF